MEYTLELSSNNTFTVLYGETGVKVERSFQWLEMIGGFEDYKKAVEDFEYAPSFQIPQELIAAFEAWLHQKALDVESRPNPRSRQLCRLN